MREIVFALAALIAFGAAGTVDVQVAEGMLAEHAPVGTIASNHQEDQNHARHH